MAKKSGVLKSNKSAGKKAWSKKPRKAGMFKALKKHEKRSAVVTAEKSDLHKNKQKVKLAKRPPPVSEEFRNFDERMAAKKLQRPRFAAVSSPTFVMGAPTFQFNANAMQPSLKPREVEGFHGFISALNAPTDMPTATLNQATRQSKPITQREYYGNNVFAVLEDEDDEEQDKKTLTTPAFMQPATFTFVKPTLTLQSSFCQSIQSTITTAAVDIDPDL
ncbi:unnamed protein product [Peronospora belbahrii]|uniref:Uncharacterized protein n=1 Tax=Peronospora belbahrii TaxID=622444 RepID=A0AAU9KL37_9STRA|nr:unnamed protein product [Peronospora belbahrii]CAH0520738.1 unnamed protein product [Peronospora belbahrii]